MGVYCLDIAGLVTMLGIWSAIAFSRSAESTNGWDASTAGSVASFVLFNIPVTVVSSVLFAFIENQLEFAELGI